MYQTCDHAMQVAKPGNRNQTDWHPGLSAGSKGSPGAHWLGQEEAVSLAPPNPPGESLA